MSRARSIGTVSHRAVRQRNPAAYELAVPIALAAGALWLPAPGMAQADQAQADQAQADQAQTELPQPERHPPDAAPGSRSADPSSAPAAPHVHRFRLGLKDMGLAPGLLEHTERATQHLYFRARADHVITSAVLHLVLTRPELEHLEAIEVLLNAEPVAQVAAEALQSRPTRHRIRLPAASLAGTNTLTLRMRVTGEPNGCGRVPPGSFRALHDATLTLESRPLPLPSDLGVLPLPYLDPQFDREQALHFVIPDPATATRLQTMAQVAGWFALQGQGRLSFVAHVGELPADDAVVFVDGRSAARRLGLPATSVAAPGEARLTFVAHPSAANRKLLVVSGDGEAMLTRAARGLLRDGTQLQGASAHFDAPVVLPPLPNAHVPRWASPGHDVRFDKLPGNPPLRLEGGGTLRVPFRLPPDLFVWPEDHVDLELAYAQGGATSQELAQLYVELNGASLATLPATREGRVALQVPRSRIRGYNELLLHARYASATRPSDGSCEAGSAPDGWVAIAPESRLKLRRARRFVELPHVEMFLYDGFPFTALGDLRTTTALLPSRPAPQEITSLLGLVGQLASVTGHPPTGLRIRLGHVAPDTLKDRDVLIVAAHGRHPLYTDWSRNLPLQLAGGPLRIRPANPEAHLWRLLTGRFGDRERVRVAAHLDPKRYAAVLGIADPPGGASHAVVVTASTPQRMPQLSTLHAPAESEASRNDLWLGTEEGRLLAQLEPGTSRGALPPLLAARFWLARYWLLLLPALFLAAVAWSRLAHTYLARLVHRRLHEGET